MMLTRGCLSPYSLGPVRVAWMPHIRQFFQARPSHQALRTSPSAPTPRYPASASACLGSDVASSWSHPTTWPQVPLHAGVAFLFTCASLRLSFGRADRPLSRLLHASSVYPACEHWAHNQQAMNAWHRLKKEQRAGSCRQPFPADHAVHFRACMQHPRLPARRKCGCQCSSRWQDSVHQERRPLQWSGPCVHGLSKIKVRVINWTVPQNYDTHACRCIQFWTVCHEC